jgi:hypothetical protein
MDFHEWAIQSFATFMKPISVNALIRSPYRTMNHIILTEKELREKVMVPACCAYPYPIHASKAEMAYVGAIPM